MPIEKTYESAATESRLYPMWEASGAFACDPKSKADPYCIMIPPPNVTGSLHMGHGLTFTIQDALIRYQRMKGRDTLWQPGTDHAGIATQMVVERMLAAKGIDRREMGREAFLKKVWEWKAESGGTITKQLRRLGASLDWPRERFTMDEGLNKAVTRVFVQLFNEGLIYKDKRLVNWDPKMLSAISDLEVEMKEVKGHMWHFRYPLADDPTQFLCIATTRPETMLGDGAVAVNPNDERYKHLIGKMVTLPLANRLIPVIADEHADPEKGSGAVKVTAAHDFNDYQVWLRHRDKDYFKCQMNGGLINLFDKHAYLNENCPEAYRGLDRYEARKRIIADLEELGLVDKIENITHAVPHGDRSGVVIEPWLSEQWYCDAQTLAKPALEAVESGKTKFVPEQWTNTYYAWMRNIEPWCISRQLWWGHQIPAWYHLDVEEAQDQLKIDLTAMNAPFRGGSKDWSQFAYVVRETEEEALGEIRNKYPNSQVKVVDNYTQALALWQTEGVIGIWRDEDVLDTWFSSALWPFSTLGWPEQTPELARYYPTDCLVTGFDIIFFWVARMMMMGMHFMKDVPFRTVYIHALVRDEKGQKMSKSKGNIIDPLVTIDQYGCDALRFTLANLSTPGRDIKLATSRIETSRNFATKLWNAARFCQMNECAWDASFDPASVKHTVNKWIVGETLAAADNVAAHLDSYRFDLATHAVYEFIWNTFCDWYLEFTKPVLAGDDASAAAETKATTAWVLAQMLKILHPFMPYITEELWAQIVGDGKLLMTTAWPTSSIAVDKAAQDEMNWVTRLVGSVRNVRAELNVPAGAQITLLVKGANDTTQKRLVTHEAIIKKLARLSTLSKTAETPKNAAQAIVDEATFILPLEGVIDLAAERARLAKEIAKWADEIKKVEVKLANQNFVARAPQEILDEHYERRTNAQNMIEKLEAAKKGLEG